MACLSTTWLRQRLTEFTRNPPGVCLPLSGIWALLTSAVFGLSTSCAQQQPADPLPELQVKVKHLDQQLDVSIRGWFEEHCTACHSGDEADGELDLTKPFRVKNVVKSAEKWRRLWQRVEAGEMPPPDHAVLTHDEQKVLGDWLGKVLYEVACEVTVPRRSPAVRRLTRDEFRRAVADLTGVTYETAEQFPADEVGHGFDNIADLLSVSPLLMEKYLSAAEEIATQAIIDPAAYRLEHSWNGIDLTGGEHVYPAEQDQVLASGGELTAKISLPKAGAYELEVVAWGQQAGNEACRMGVIADGKQLEEFEVTAGRRRPSKHPLKVELTAGEHQLGVSFNNDYYDPDNPDRNQRDRNLAIRRLSLKGPVGIEIPAGPRQAELVFVRPDERTRPAAAARQVLERLAARAFRREVEQAEVLRLVTLFDEQQRWGASYEAALQTCLVAILTSPSFLFKQETIPSPGEVSLLPDRELAQSISFFLWSRPADDELLASASAAGLKEPVQLAQQVDRLLNDQRADAWLDNFVEQWLYLRMLDRLEPRLELSPPLTTDVMQAMRAETKQFVAHLVKENRPIRELVLAEYSFVNQTLAEWYGLKGEFGREDMTQVSLVETPRRGLLGQASILILTSNPDRTSPVKRGKWILETLLNQPPPPPAPEVPQLDSQTQLSGTLRQKMEQHRSDPNCASCHLKMDALGFALERYDSAGRWRDQDGGQKIDDRGELPGGIGVAGATQLAQILSDQYERQIARGFVEKLLTFSLGRGLTLHDDQSVAKILEECQANGYRFRDLIQAVIASKAFQMRSGGPGTSGTDESQLPPSQESGS